MKKVIILLLFVFLVFNLASCNKTNTPPNNNDVVEKEEPQEDLSEKDDIVEPTPKTDKVEVTLYFANKEYIETGDESLEKLIPETRVIEYGDISIEETIVKELIKGPESDKLSTVIPSNIKLLGVEVADKTAFVNFSQEGLYGGSTQEEFTISQIVNSLLELEHIEKVQFLVDGQKAETLMGHIEISEPFEK